MRSSPPRSGIGTLPSDAATASPDGEDPASDPRRDSLTSRNPMLAITNARRKPVRSFFPFILPLPASSWSRRGEDSFDFFRRRYFPRELDRTVHGQGGRRHHPERNDLRDPRDLLHPVRDPEAFRRRFRVLREFIALRTSRPEDLQRLHPSALFSLPFGKVDRGIKVISMAGIFATVNSYFSDMTRNPERRTGGPQEPGRRPRRNGLDGSHFGESRGYMSTFGEDVYDTFIEQGNPLP